MMGRLADIFARHRGLFLLGLIGLTAVAGIGITRLTYDDELRNIIRSSDGEFSTLTELQTHFGSDDKRTVLVLQGPNVISPEAVRIIRGVVEAVEKIDGIKTVHSLDDAVVVKPGRLPRSLLPADGAKPEAYAQARRDALANPLLVGQVLSEDTRTALIVANLEEDTGGAAQMKPIVEGIRRIGRRATAGTAFRTSLTGVPPIRVEIVDQMKFEMFAFTAMSVSLALMVATVLFRRVLAVLIVASGALVGTAWTMGALGLIGQPINLVNSVVPTLVLVIGFADAVHLMVDIRHSRAAGLPALASSASAIRHLGPACGIASLTTAFGFGSLFAARADIIQSFGLQCAGGVGLTFLAVLTAIPLLASTRLGKNIHVRPGARFVAGQMKWVERLVRWVTRHRRIVAVAGVLLTVGLLISALRLKPDNRVMTVIPSGSDSTRALRHLDESLGGAFVAFVLVDWSESQTLASPAVLSAVEEAQGILRSEPTMKYPLSVVDLLRSLPGPGRDLSGRVGMLRLVPEELRTRFVRPDLREALISVHITDAGAQAYLPVFDRVESGLRELEKKYPGVRMQLTGTSVVAARNINRMVGDLAKSLGLAAFLVFTVMGASFRSLRLGLICVIPNIFPLVVTAALLSWMGRPLEMISVIVFSICLGIAVDDTIHAMARFQREMQIDGDVRVSIVRSFSAVGSALVTTTTVLVCAFVVLLFSQFPSSHLFAVLACVAIASAIVGDLLILPALVACFVPSRVDLPP